MSKFTNPLDGVRVAAPCPANWERMVGDERMRYCGQCNLHVYNLSGMTRTEAESLITNAEGRLCVRFYRRGDGTILTRNCPIGLRALKRRFSRTAGAMLSAVLGFLAGVGLDLGFATRATTTTHTMGTVALPITKNYDAVEPEHSIVGPVLPLIQGQASINRHAVVGRMVRREYVAGDMQVEGVRRHPKRLR